MSCRYPMGLFPSSFWGYDRLTGLAFGEDAMNEIGWCYLEGFGCKKDKVSQLGMKTSLSLRASPYIVPGISVLWSPS